MVSPIVAFFALVVTKSSYERKGPTCDAVNAFSKFPQVESSDKKLSITKALANFKP